MQLLKPNKIRPQGHFILSRFGPNYRTSTISLVNLYKDFFIMLKIFYLTFPFGCGIIIIEKGKENPKHQKGFIYEICNEF